MRDTVIAGKQVTPAVELEKQIHQINAGEVVPAEEPTIVQADDLEDLDTGDTVSVEFTIEPEESVSMVIVDTPLNDELAEIEKSEPPPPEPEPEPAPSPKAAKKKKTKK